MLKRGEAVFANLARTPPQHFRATIFKILFSIYQINFNHILQDCHTATLKCREHVLVVLVVVEVVLLHLLLLLLLALLQEVLDGAG